jgi:hypothetical protein
LKRRISYGIAFNKIGAAAEKQYAKTKQNRTQSTGFT